MWRNTVVAEFIDWLRLHNDGLPPAAEKVGFTRRMSLTSPIFSLPALYTLTPRTVLFHRGDGVGRILVASVCLG
jgi:hypothetical protein